MANNRSWQFAFITLLLVSSIVGHYVGDVFCDLSMACEAESAETHPLHSTMMLTESGETPKPATVFETYTAYTSLQQSHIQPPLLRPPIAL